MKIAAILAALQIAAWLPCCEAALRVAAQEKLLLRRLRQQRVKITGGPDDGNSDGPEPFIVSFRVKITGGPDNEVLAKKLSTGINTPGSPLAKLMSYSVARVYNGTFPPVAMPTSTTFGTALPTVTPPPLQASTTKNDIRTTQPSAMATALQALAMADRNTLAYNDLAKRMSEATNAHAEALVFGNPPGTTPEPTLPPAIQQRVDEEKYPYTLGRLIYDAFINTPPPVPLHSISTSPMIPMVPIIAGGALPGSLPGAAAGTGSLPGSAVNPMYAAQAAPGQPQAVLAPGAAVAR